MNKKKIVAQIHSLRSELRVIEKAERIKRLKPFVGGFYKTEEDNYRYYTAVTSLTESGYLKGFSFQEDSEGRIEFMPLFPVSEFLSKKISKNEFYAAFDETIKRAEALRGTK